MPKIKMSELWLKKLKPPEKGQIEYADTICKGVMLRIGKSGTKTFSVVRWVPVPNKQKRATLGRYPEISLAKARDEAREVILK